MPKQKRYDLFLNKAHPSWVQNFFSRYNRNIVSVLLSKLDKTKISILEIGPGKGYFYQAIREHKVPISYTALDQNENILKHVGAPSVYVGSAPNLPKFKKKFDIIYIAYVIEHLQDGRMVYELIQNCQKYVNPEGVIVFLVPDAMRQGMEFWNSDYTHSYPTSKRNVAMAFFDSGIPD